jgi:N-acetylneuraminate synthase
LHELYAEAHTPWEWHPELFRLAEEIGITLFSAPFDNSAIDFLEDLNCPAYKIASPELIDLPLISRAAETGKPLILSTGMATEEEISEAIEVARSKKTKDVVVLHCTSSYPASLSDANLRTIPAIAKKHNVNVGLSDHTEGILASIIAVALGACMVEKHFTLKRADGGVDSAFSLETQELKALVSEVSRASSTLGQPSFHPLEAEQMVLANRRSLYVTSAIARGEKFTLENVRSIRPGKGLKPKYLHTILGKTAARAINFGEPLDETMITEKIR